MDESKDRIEQSRVYGGGPVRNLFHEDINLAALDHMGWAALKKKEKQMLRNEFQSICDTIKMQWK